MSTGTIATILLVAHFLFHIGGSVGVILGLIHWNNVHKQSLWKVVATLIWTAISLIALFSSISEHQQCH